MSEAKNTTQRDTNGIGNILKFVVEAPLKAPVEALKLGEAGGRRLAYAIDPKKAAQTDATKSSAANQPGGQSWEGRLLNKEFGKLTTLFSNLANFAQTAAANVEGKDQATSASASKTPLPTPATTNSGQVTAGNLVNSQGRSVAPTLNKAATDVKTVQTQNQNALQTSNQKTNTTDLEMDK